MLTRAEFDAALAYKPAPGFHIPAFQPGMYESPIEERLAWSLAKILDRQDVTLTSQCLVPTAHGAYRTDLLLHSPGRNTVIECDGKAFHQDYLADCARSAALLESGFVDQVVRYPGSVLNFSPDDAVYSLSLLHPEAFQGRAAQVARTRASFMAERTRLEYDAATPDDFLYSVNYDVEGHMDDCDFYDEDGGYQPAPFTREYLLRTDTVDVHRVESQNERDTVVVMRQLQRQGRFGMLQALVDAYSLLRDQRHSAASA